MTDEADLIERYLRALGPERDDVELGIGDDAALVRVPAGQSLVATTDALVEGVHFVPAAPAHSLGHRALAVNLSDIAAMGATPCWALLSLILPRAADDWLRDFCRGFGALARASNVALVGGNLSRGPLSITVELLGVLPPGAALRRDGARAGDELYVSGTVGEAAAGRELLHGGAGCSVAGSSTEADATLLRRRFEYPTARVELGLALRALATACIDVSDGLLTDATRLATASGCGAVLELERLPVSQALRRQCGPAAETLALSGGEDYELCFAAPPAAAPALAAVAQRLGVPLSRIGSLVAGAGVSLVRGGRGVAAGARSAGFDHFRD